MIDIKRLHLSEKRIAFQKLHFEQIKIRRIYAVIIDLLLMIGAFTITLIILKKFDIATDGFIYYSFWLYIFYYGIHLSSKNSATVGMKIAKIKAVDKSGKIIRALACFSLPFITLIGLFPLLIFIENFQKADNSLDPLMLLILTIYFAPYMNSRKRTYQDLLAGTVFIRTDTKYSNI